MKRSMLVVAICLLVSTVNAVADVGGKIGIAPGGFSFSVDDPNGGAERATALAPFALAAVYDLNNKNRIFTSFTYLDFDLDAGTDNVGQSITGYQILCAYQHAVRLSYTLQFYVGGGLAYTSADFKDRYTVDDEGFLATAYDDRHEDVFALVVSLSKEWEAHRWIDLGFDLSYQHAVHGDGFSGFRAAVTCFYKFLEAYGATSI